MLDFRYIYRTIECQVQIRIIHFQIRIQHIIDERAVADGNVRIVIIIEHESAHFTFQCFQANHVFLSHNSTQIHLPGNTSEIRVIQKFAQIKTVDYNIVICALRAVESITTGRQFVKRDLIV
ncbi:hypothetical protein D3C71_1231660 [compost metagenome]